MRTASLRTRSSAMVAVGVAGQTGGQHVPPAISGMLIAVGGALMALDRLTDRPRHERIADLERDTGVGFPPKP